MLIKTVRSDNGSEFSNSNFQNFLTQKGIIHQISCVYTPQQNGVVERKHQNLLQLASALLLQASLPLKFWGEVVLTVTYLVNKLPSNLLDWKTLFELLYKQVPNIRHLRVFGCGCFASNRVPSRSKFDPRARKSIVVRYASGQKGYRLYDLVDIRIFVSRDVIFHESFFPFAAKSQKNSHICLHIHVTELDLTDGVEPSTDPDLVFTRIYENSSLSPTSDVHGISDAIDLSPDNFPPLPPRVRQKPHWMKDYVVNIASIPTDVQESISYDEAVTQNEWILAMQKELNALEKNHTWEICHFQRERKL